MTTPSTPDIICIETRRDYVRRELGDRRTHVFRRSDGGELPCAGPGRCRECNREGTSS